MIRLTGMNSPELVLAVASTGDYPVPGLSGSCMHPPPPGVGGPGILGHGSARRTTSFPARSTRCNGWPSRDGASGATLTWAIERRRGSA